MNIGIFMKVLNINSHSTNNKPTFTSLRISYNAENILADNAGALQINNLFEAGKKLENTQFFDLEVLEDLTLRIKEKANVFSGIVEPIIFYKKSSQNLRVQGIYDGLDFKYHKRGQGIGITLRYDLPETADRIFKEIQSLNGVLRIAAITKLIDDYFIKTKICWI